MAGPSPLGAAETVARVKKNSAGFASSDVNHSEDRVHTW